MAVMFCLIARSEGSIFGVVVIFTLTDGEDLGKHFEHSTRLFVFVLFVHELGRAFSGTAIVPR